MDVLPAPFEELRTLGPAHLRTVEPRFAPLIDSVGPCTLEVEKNTFRSLTRAVVAQLISTAAARTISGRLEEKLKGRVTPARLLALPETELRAAGLSGSKVKTLRGLAEAFQSSRSFGTTLRAASDERVREILLPLHGVGHWTVDMALIFAFGRPDVWPVGDMGVRAAVKTMFGMKDLPGAEELTALAAPWRPYRSFAAWYLWRSRGWVPQSEAT